MTSYTEATRIIEDFGRQSRDFSMYVLRAKNHTGWFASESEAMSDLC